MKLANVNEFLCHRITGGSEYLWNCFGHNARYLDYESEHAHGSVIFDTVTGQVYQAEVSDKADKVRPYRYTDPAHKDVYLAECREKNVDPNNAWDDTTWVDLDLESDWLVKAKAIFEGKEFDQRVEVPLDLDDKTILALALEAHKRDITINKMVELILEKAIADNK